MLFDYFMADEILKEENMNYLVMERHIAHKFSVGMILTGRLSTANDESFFACWRREIVDLHEIEKVRILTANCLHSVFNTKTKLRYAQRPK